MPTAEATRPKNHLARRVVPITASIDGDGNAALPTRIELVRAGSWPDESNKGMFYILPTDLLEMKANFDSKIGTPGNSGMLAIDLRHEDYDVSACWIHAMEVEGDVLYATELEFTPTGSALILGGEFKFVSPSFYPACLGEWCDPEDWSISAKNVVVGAGFTNIPFFKNLQPVKASQDSQEGNGRDDKLFVSADAKGVSMPTLEEVRIKASLDDLDEAEKTLLTENQDKLSTEEKVKFGFETAPVDADNKNNEEGQMTEEQKQAAQIQADIKSGKKVLVDASEHDALKASVTALQTSEEATRREKVTASVEAGMAKGKIVADQKDEWVKIIMANSAMQITFDSLPENKILADANGGDAGDEGDANATEDLESKIQEAITASEGKLSYSEAVKKVAASNAELVKTHEKELITAKRGE